MSALPKLKIGLVAAGLSCLMLGTAWSQEREREYELETQNRDADAGRVETGQIDRPTLQGQPHTAQFRGTQPGTAHQKQPLQNFLASCLLQKNKGEVELGQIAQRQAQNPEVKEFAQRMVQDHQQVVQKLQPLAGMQGERTSAVGQSDAQRQPTSTTAGATQNRTAGDQNAALQQLAQIDRQITQRYLDSVREELQQKQGAEFDKCYIGSQVGGHMHMVAALEVIEQQGPDQLRQIAQQALPKVKEHLEHAKQLMAQLEGGSPTSQAERRQGSPTQR